MAFNDLLQQSTLLILPLFLTSLHSILQNFTAAIPAHHCRPPADGNLSKDRELEVWLPRDKQGQPESCLRFTFPQREPPLPNGTEANGTGATEPCTNGWIYDNSTFPSNIVTEWDLVCTHKTLPQLSQSIFMARTLVGSLMFGTLADRLGRQKVLIWTYLQLAVSGTCTAFTPNFSAYCICRFLSGMATSPINSNSVTLSLEWLPIHARPCLGLLVRLVPSLSQFFVAGMAYAMPQWRHLQLLVSLPFFVFFIYSRFLIESALWYSSLGRLDLTLKVFWRVAQINGKQEEGAKLSIGVRTLPQKDLTMGQAQPSMLQLLRSPAVRRLFLCLLPPWFANYFSIFGLVMSLQSFGINIYLLQGLFAVVDLPFYFLGFWAVKSLGRKPTQMASLLLSGIFILAYAMIPLDQSFLRTTMAVLGKGCITGSINCLSIYTSELYPTVMRQRGQSMSGTLANTGSIVSPLVGMTAELHPSLPFFFYGAVPMAVCPIIVLLPETIGQPLPNTVLDLERRWAAPSLILPTLRKQQEQRGRE
uniref:Major facilitator superfamily (MFS) profile domain-containing protein n=1 Tax=Equus asinus TaxID=9793 RepID=A0A8C4LUD2_EQUAS